MIRVRALAHVLGPLLVALAALFLVPLGWAVWRRDPGIDELGVSTAITLAAGAALWTWGKRPDRALGGREATLLVAVAWLAVVLFGALPFAFDPAFPTFADAFFESASGFTTTGATVLEKVEVLDAPIQFWRCFTHWIGGMGIVLLGIAILPLVGHGGMNLYRAEFSGARSEKIRPRIAETARSLWKVYLALTIAQYVAMRLAGVSPFESLCHTFGTLGTGGFSTRTASVGGFESPAVEWIVITFMFLSGMSFVQHYRWLVERRVGSVWRDVEFRGYVAVALAATALIVPFLMRYSGYDLERAIRGAAFQVVSIQTTTGFMSEDFELWHPLPQVLLLSLMFIGGCTGSTAGGLKVARVMLLGGVVYREFRRMVERRGVFAVRQGGKVVPEETIQGLLSLVYLAFLVNFVSVLALAAAGVDVLTAISAVAACMFNVGPGLGTVGPAEYYGHLPQFVKWVLSGCMIAGRLEFYTTIVILTPAFWRR
ncbi:MAG TPA: potassium transporter TrkG [Candidatus Polarisedimenticolaceae bacterium]